jgi:carbamate kinase
MMKKRIVVALGGNAILQPKQEPSYLTQLENVEKSCVVLAKLVEEGYELVISHGNGPQVGNLLRQNEEAKDVVPQMPLDVLSAETQGFIGYMIQQSLVNELNKLGINKSVVTLVTRVEVSKDDERFKDPSKPIGTFYTEEEAKVLSDEKGWLLKEDSNRGYRRVVPSPKPIKIVEANIINKLLKDDVIVIAGGGGGIPVVLENNGNYEGIEAVIDKDLSSCKIAEETGADIFMILTDVDNVYINYGKPEQKELGEISVAELEEYVQEGHFAKGSMGPKIDAALAFAKTGRKSYICSLEQAANSLKGQSGTIIG